LVDWLNRLQPTAVIEKPRQWFGGAFLFMAISAYILVAEIQKEQAYGIKDYLSDSVD